MPSEDVLMCRNYGVADHVRLIARCLWLSESVHGEMRNFEITAVAPEE